MKCHRLKSEKGVHPNYEVRTLDILLSRFWQDVIDEMYCDQLVKQRLVK